MRLEQSSFEHKDEGLFSQDLYEGCRVAMLAQMCFKKSVGQNPIAHFGKDGQILNIFFKWTKN